LAERRSLELLGEVERMRAGVGAAMGRLKGRFGQFEREGAAACGEPAMRTARGLLFLEKWDGQLREAWAKLVG
jgi:hypothetical protein